VPDKYAVAAGGSSAAERASLYLRALQEREDETGVRLAAKRKREEERAKSNDPRHGETCEKYFWRLTKVRESEGVRDVRKERTIWGKWLSPRIGKRPIADVTRDEIEAIRDVLDDAVRLRIKDGLRAGTSGATAQNVWSVLRTMFKESVSARDRTRRVRADDPTSGHKAPLKTAKREKTFIYPNEFSRLLACEKVPRVWREVYALAAYTYVRPEELQALTWEDVDFNAGTIHVSKAISAGDGKPKPLPKTRNAVRTVPIDPALVPLLAPMHAAAKDDAAPILPVLGELNDFRSCRDTGITWLALAGVELPLIQRRAGHEDSAT